jgi:hypothetical protein
MDWWGSGGLSDTTTWGLVVGVVLPWLTAVVQQPRWTVTQRKVVAIVIAVIGGLLTALANGTLDEGRTVLSTFAALLVASQATYRGLWKGTVATAIEYATSPKTQQQTGPQGAVTPSDPL